MILRLMGLMLGGALAYAMLRGWPAFLPGLSRAGIAVVVLAAALGWWALGRRNDEVPLAEGASKPSWLDIASIGLAATATSPAPLARSKVAVP